MTNPNKSKGKCEHAYTEDTLVCVRCGESRVTTTNLPMSKDWKKTMAKEIREHYSGIVSEEVIQGAIKWWIGLTEAAIKEEKEKAYEEGQIDYAKNCTCTKIIKLKDN